MPQKFASAAERASITPPKKKWAAIVGVLCVIVIFALFILPPKVGSHDGRPTAATLEIKFIGVALDAYKKDTGAYPQSIDGLQSLIRPPTGTTNWHGAYFAKDIPLDPWQQNYIYISPGIHNPQTYDLSSRGPDGYVGTDDDIGNWPQD